MVNIFNTLQAAALTTALFVFCPATALADAPLKEALGLSMDQAKAAGEIHNRRFPEYQKKRGEYNSQMRKLRRARIANDSAAVAREDAVARQLHGEMMALKHAEDAEVRKLLNPEQSKKFDAYLKQRSEMVGSSRDDKEYTGK